jgi:hypothetical protein
MEIKSEFRVMRWMIGVTLALEVATLIKLFLD